MSRWSGRLGVRQQNIFLLNPRTGRMAVATEFFDYNLFFVFLVVRDKQATIKLAKQKQFKQIKNCIA